jgi:RES domain-containing protein
MIWESPTESFHPTVGIRIEKYSRQVVPASEQKSKDFGDVWIAEKRTLILLVPSIASDGDWNALINPAHADFGRLLPTSEKAVRWDRRLFGKNKQFQKLK